jgi:hypothetical protein
MAMKITAELAAMKMSGTTRASLALEALKKSRPITALSDVYNVSRQFIHKQKNKAVDSINKVFSDADLKSDDEKILFNLPVTKSWVKQLIL